MGTAGPGGRYRLGRLGAASLLLIPLLGVTAAARQDSAGQEGVVTAARAADAGATRVAYAGTRHQKSRRGRQDDVQQSAVRHRPGPFRRPAVRPGRLAGLASRRDEQNPQIYLRSADGSVRRLTSGMKAAHPRLTPNGRAVVLNAAAPGGRTAGSSATCGWCAPTAPA
ncbi:hypothetical protein LT493_13255 [Streptomyces tricolor]|nr:hypothetical protein [Streptomyces tricolor]